MPTPVQVTIHPSQFPDRVLQSLAESLRTRRVNHKFHYDSYKQTRKWLELHQAYSPSRTDPNCAAIYDLAFAAAAQCFGSGRVHLVGLGCGGGQKDLRLLQKLTAEGVQTSYSPVDVSLPMVLVARQATAGVAPECHPLVLDLAEAEDLAESLQPSTPTEAGRLITFFGMIPNFEPDHVLPKLARLLRAGDTLLFSANLAPGNDYAEGVRRILPLYENDLTGEWLLTFLLDLGVERRDGKMEWVIESGAHEFLRVAAYFQFKRSVVLQLAGERFEFAAGEKMRLFFSYRYTPGNIEAFLSHHGLQILNRWITESQEEGVFLCRRNPE